MMELSCGKQEYINNGKENDHKIRGNIKRWKYIKRIETNCSKIKRKKLILSSYNILKLFFLFSCG